MKERRTPTGGYVQRSTGPEQGAVGKRTLVESVQRRRVQQRAEAAEGADNAAVHAAAEHGTSGASSALPHLDRIQQSFGRHDVSGVQAHTGQQAAEGAQAMGAQAYASGDHVAFARQPDLHLAAHEAAHTVQQRNGVQLSGGVGAVGDGYEKHADEVADAVVAGRSAEGLLDAGPGGGGGGGSVQRAVQRGGADPVNDKSAGPSQQINLDHGAGHVPGSAKGDAGPKPAKQGADAVDDPFHHPFWPQFEARVMNLFALLGSPAGVDPPALARQMWAGVCQGMKSSQHAIKNDASIYQGGDLAGRFDMGSQGFQQIIQGFNAGMSKLEAFTSSEFARARSFGFWSTGAGRKLAEALCDITLETSGIGALFDGIPSLDGQAGAGWDVHLWAALSDAYGNAVGEQLAGGGKMAHVCVGPNAATGNIFEKVESIAIKKKLSAVNRNFSKVVRFHGAAVHGTDKENVDFTVHRGDFPGTAYSGKDLQAARDAATAYYDSKKPQAGAPAQAPAAPQAAPAAPAANAAPPAQAPAGAPPPAHAPH